jgi:ankyrin repeat protein
MRSQRWTPWAVALCVSLATSARSRAGSYDDYFIALKNDHVSVVRELLDLGFDPNARDPRGQPGLDVAIQADSPKVVRVLLEQPKIDVNALNAAGESPLMLAALKGDMADALLLLARGARVNQSGWSALHYAATGPQLEMVELLIEHGAALDAPAPNGTTPLMMAAQYGSEDCVTLLLQRGADPQRRNLNGLSALDFAEASGREPLVQRLAPLVH